jgi:uncharacterized membrane protein YcaP (DUF421 family)
MDIIFFNGWNSVLRALIITLMAYISIVFLLRISGKRTLSKMNAFDFIVTIALGSALASISTSRDITLAEGLTVFIVLIFMQLIITWVSVRVKILKKIITSQPVMLLYKGEVIGENMKRERVTIEEINNEVRKKGLSNLQDIDIIVLETTGDITIIERLESPAQSVQNIKGV